MADSVVLLNQTIQRAEGIVDTAGTATIEVIENVHFYTK
jgi:hypothetical protein